jgi:hypothetical protein
MKIINGRNLLRTIAAALVALASASAQAETYTFTQGGFTDGTSISGYFNAHDDNGNGQIAGSEVQSFFAAVLGGLYNGITFESTNTGRYQSYLVYDLGSRFLGDGAGETLDAYSGLQLGYISGASGGSVYDGFGQYPSSTTAEFININEPALPVPEPETWAMLLAGLFLVPLLAKRKKAA